MSTHIFIFVRHCDLHFTLLPDLFRQVKANKLLMNKSVKYSPPSQLPIQMLLISPAFCVVCSYKAPDSSTQASSLGRDKHSQPRVPRKWVGARPEKVWGVQIFHLRSLVDSVQACFIEGTTSCEEGFHLACELSLTRGPEKKPGPEPSLSFSDQERDTSHKRRRMPGLCGPYQSTLP